MKKIIRVEVGSLDYYGSSAESVIEQLNYFVKVYGSSNVSLSTAQYKYSDDTYVAILASREETDGEYRVRLVDEETIATRTLERERQTFETLKKKFGG